MAAARTIAIACSLERSAVVGKGGLWSGGSAGAMLPAHSRPDMLRTNGATDEEAD